MSKVKEIHNKIKEQSKLSLSKRHSAKCKDSATTRSLMNTDNVFSESAISRNFISENVNNIQKLQRRASNALKLKSDSELKKQYWIHNQRKMDQWRRSKSSTNHDFQFSKKQKKSKKKDKFVRNNRSQSPELEQIVEPQTIIETVHDIVPEVKPQRVVVHKCVHTGKQKKVVNVRDFGCQCGDPKRTFFFEDGSNINLYIPSKETIPKKKKEVSPNIPYVVSSRYLLFKKKIFDQDMARQFKPIKKVVDRKKEHHRIFSKELRSMEQDENDELQYYNLKQKGELQSPRYYSKLEDYKWINNERFDQKYNRVKTIKSY